MRLGAPTSKTRFLWRLSLFDVFWAITAPFIALALRDPALLSFDATQDVLPHSYQYAVLTIIFAIPAFLFFRLGDGMSRFFAARDLWSIASATFAIVAASDVTLFAINRLEGVPRSTPLIYGLVLAAGLGGGRALARLSGIERWGVVEDKVKPHLRRVVMVGVDRFAAIVIKLTDCQQPRTTQIVAALDRRERLSGRTINGVKIVGRPADLAAVIEEYAVHGVEIDEVWLADHSTTHEEATRIEQQCRAFGVKARAISHALNLTPLHAPIFHAPRTDASVVTTNGGYFRFKRSTDAVMAAILLILLAPLALIIAGVTYLDVGAPVIFWQRRIGQGGREFFLFKFRTYQAPYTRNGEPVAGEVRLSKIGKTIRATRLDEIPQLVNILRGDMSLIGPRPLLPIDQPKDPTSRLLVRPGVTGWAQIMGGTLVTAEEKDALDVWYIHHASPLLDIKIIIRTLKIVFHGENKHHDEIDAALKWHDKMRRIDESLFGAAIKGNGHESVNASHYDLENMAQSRAVV